ncbi:MAG TPA: hypothetical protein VIT38_04460 [Allosphingosinicella sp.]
MRLCWTAAIALFFAASPAEADVTARYTLAGDAPPMIVQVRDNGDSRVVVTDAVYLTAGGTSYLVASDAQGQFVVRKDDFLSLLAELMRLPGPSRSLGEAGPVISEHGTEIVGGRPGRVFRISMATNPADNMEFVVSDDPALATLGRVVANELEPFFSAMVARTDPRLAVAVNDLFHRGAVIRLGNQWHLESIEDAPLPASQFVLPSAPIGRDALAERLRARAAR